MKAFVRPGRRLMATAGVALLALVATATAAADGPADTSYVAAFTNTCLTVDEVFLINGVMHKTTQIQPDGSAKVYITQSGRGEVPFTGVVYQVSEETREYQKPAGVAFDLVDYRKVIRLGETATEDDDLFLKTRISSGGPPEFTLECR